MKRALSFAYLLFAAIAVAFSPVVSGAPADSAQPDPEKAPLDTVEELGLQEAEHDERACLRRTGSRIDRMNHRERERACEAGRSYSREDIRRTGASSLSEALHRLDPSLNIRRR